MRKTSIITIFYIIVLAFVLRINIAAAKSSAHETFVEIPDTLELTALEALAAIKGLAPDYGNNAARTADSRFLSDIGRKEQQIGAYETVAKIAPHLVTLEEFQSPKAQSEIRYLRGILSGKSNLVRGRDIYYTVRILMRELLANIAMFRLTQLLDVEADLRFELADKPNQEINIKNTVDQLDYPKTAGIDKSLTSVWMNQWPARARHLERYRRYQHETLRRRLEIRERHALPISGNFIGRRSKLLTIEEHQAEIRKRHQFLTGIGVHALHLLADLFTKANSFEDGLAILKNEDSDNQRLELLVRDSQPNINEELDITLFSMVGQVAISNCAVLRASVTNSAQTYDILRSLAIHEKHRPSTPAAFASLSAQVDSFDKPLQLARIANRLKDKRNKIRQDFFAGPTDGECASLSELESVEQIAWLDAGWSELARLVADERLFADSLANDDYSEAEISRWLGDAKKALDKRVEQLKELENALDSHYGLLTINDWNKRSKLDPLDNVDSDLNQELLGDRRAYEAALEDALTMIEEEAQDVLRTAEEMWNSILELPEDINDFNAIPGNRLVRYQQAAVDAITWEPLDGTKPIHAIDVALYARLLTNLENEEKNDAPLKSAYFASTTGAAALASILIPPPAGPVIGGSLALAASSEEVLFAYDAATEAKRLAHDDPFGSDSTYSLEESQERYEAVYLSMLFAGIDLATFGIDVGRLTRVIKTPGPQSQAVIEATQTTRSSKTSLRQKALRFYEDSIAAATRLKHRVANTDIEDLRKQLVAERATFSRIRSQMQAEIDRLRETAFVDDITGLKNGKALAYDFPSIVADAKRAGETLSIVFVDVKKFKVFNDVFGWLDGNAMLEEAAKTMLSRARESDHIFRLAGDEFIIIMKSPSAEVPAIVDAMNQQLSQSTKRLAYLRKAREELANAQNALSSANPAIREQGESMIEVIRGGLRDTSESFSIPETLGELSYEVLEHNGRMSLDDVLELADPKRAKRKGTAG